jgi:hypothetical protein
MQDARTAFRLYLLENGINIVLAILLVGPLGVRGLALSVSVAYSVAALVAMSVVRKRVGGLGGPDLTTPVRRVVGASAAMAVTTILALSVSGATSGSALLARVVFAVVVGVITYVGTAAILGSRQARRAMEERAGRAGLTGSASAPRQAPPDSTVPTTFRGRLDVHSDESTYRHLRPVTAPERDPGPTDEPASGDEEEDVDGPYPGGNR